MAELLDMKALVEPKRALTDEEIRRYSRHLLIPDIDLVGQQRLINAKVLCVGAGGLGSPTIIYLAAAGVGTIGIIDYDKVEINNLQRQIIHFQADLGKSKAHSAEEKVNALNSSINVNVYDFRLNEVNVLEIFKDYDVIIDCTDNFATRYLINDAAALLGKPYIWGSIYRFDGQATLFWSNEGPCYRCIHPTPPSPGSVPSCAEGGVLGVLCGAIGSIQSNEAIKLITGIGKTLLGKLLIYDALEGTYQKLDISKSPNCPICNGSQNSLLDSYENFCNGNLDAITASELKAKIDGGKDILIIDVRNPEEHAASAIPNSILIPKSKFEDGSAFELLPKDRELIVHCNSGGRSAKCLAILKSAGFANSRHLLGGIIAWKRIEMSSK